MRTDDPLEKSLMLGKIEGRRRWRQRMRWLDGITDTMNMELGQTLGDSEGQGSLACCIPWGRKESDTMTTKIYIHLAALGLNCSMCDLQCGAQTLSCDMGDQGLNLGPLHWEFGVLATGPQESPADCKLIKLSFKPPSLSHHCGSPKTLIEPSCST